MTGSRGKVGPPMRKLKFALLAIGAVGIVTAGLQFLLPSGIGAERILDRIQWQIDWMKIKNVKYDVEWPLSPTRVAGWLPKIVGKNIFLFKAAPLIEDLKDKPWVRDVTVKKEFPDQLFVSVKTKRAHAIYMFRGQSFFMDSDGVIIEKMDASLFAGHDLPVVSVERRDENDSWKVPEVLKVLSAIREKLGPSGEVSEVKLGFFPTFRVFLTNYKMEIILTLDNWNSQVSELTYLLQNPPLGLGSIRRVNLTLAKKAVVSSSLSN
jgi:hypothetical protein